MRIAAIGMLLGLGLGGCGPHGRWPDPFGFPEVPPALEPDAPQESGALFKETFDGPDGLITNEYAAWNPTDGRAVRSEVWDVTSGSLFRKNGTGWSGTPDGDAPDLLSVRATDSAVFRMTTQRSDFGDVAVSLRLLDHGLTSTPRTPVQSWDGFHVFLRYQTEESLYAVSVDRRDSVVVIKKKVPGGPSNGGTYYTLASAHVADVGFQRWKDIRTTVEDLPDGSVKLELHRDGRRVLSVVDTGTGGPPITGSGQVGVRGDNCDFQIDDFEVTAI